MINFIKAQGLGNDFVIIDVEENSQIKEEDFSEIAKKISNRRLFIGCDQILFHKKNIVWFLNADGSYAESCGNGTRCLAKILMKKNNIDFVEIITKAGPVFCSKKEDKIEVKMPKPIFDKNIEIKARSNIFLKQPVYVEVGNPHIVCFVKSLEDLSDLGPIFSRQFKNGANVGFVLQDKDLVFLKVWERGVGIVPSCGSGACACAVAIYARDEIKMPIKILQDGGVLEINYDGADNIFVKGDAKIVFYGNIDL